MSQPRSKLGRFYSELGRRHVFRVVAGYAAMAFVVLQAAEIIFEGLGAPEGALTYVIVLAILGFPVTVVLAWFFDITATGLHRTLPAEATVLAVETRSAGARPHPAPRRIAVYLLAVLLTGSLGFVVTTRLIHAPGLSGRDDAARSIAVLPFTDMSAAGKGDFLSDGITEDIITALANVSGLHVISRTSVMAYRDGGRKNLRQIGRELGVATILEGSVRREGDKVRITAQLVDARTDEHLWAETFDREVDNIFEIQSEIARAIAQALVARLTPAEKARIDRAPTGNVAAYEAYHEAQRRLATLRTPDVIVGIELLHKAIAIDPGYAVARAELGDAFLLRAQLTGDGFWRDSALAAARATLAQDSTLAEGHHLLGGYYLSIGQTADALRELDRALKLKPNSAAATSGKAHALFRQGHYDEALRWFKKAARLEPRSAAHAISVGAVYAALGELGLAREWANRAAALQPNNWQPHLLLAQVRIYEGDTAAAAKRVRTMLTISGNEPIALDGAGDGALIAGDFAAARRYYERVAAMVPPDGDLAPTTPLGFLALRAGDATKAADYFRASTDRITARLWDVSSQAFVLYYEMARVFACQGDAESATQFLGDAVNGGFRDYELLRRDPLFAGIRSDPTFQRIVARLRDETGAMHARVLREKI